MYTLGRFALEELKKDDLELVRRWRNSRHVREWMVTGRAITPAEQRRWFAERRNRSDFLFTFDKEKIGSVYFPNKDPLHRRCEWGFYIGRKKYLRRGFGAVMEYMGLDLVFMRWKYNKVINLILPRHRKIVNMHKRFGFKDEGILRKHVMKGARYTDLLVQGLLREEWLKRREGIYETLKRSILCTNIR